MKITKTLIKNYSRYIGKNNFIQGYYYSTPETRYKLVIKALNIGIMNLQDKLKKENEYKAIFENDKSLIDRACFIVDMAYIDICNNK